VIDMPASEGHTCSLLAGIRIERGTAADWRRLAPLHYRSHHAGAVTDVFRMVYGDPRAPAGAGRRGEVLVGVIVYSRSPLSLAARNRATGGRYRLGAACRVSVGRLVNRELRIISRVVIAPNWRGLGLARRLVAETLQEVGTPYVEALAAMGRVHPFFERAGMTAYRAPPAAQGERLRAALESVGIDRLARRSPARLAGALDALGPAARRLADREIGRWARSYLAAKNHKINAPGRGRLLELVAPVGSDAAAAPEPMRAGQVQTSEKEVP
jgi:GNAT superfamily N-acetyltransferase